MRATAADAILQAAQLARAGKVVEASELLQAALVKMQEYAAVPGCEEIGGFFVDEIRQAPAPCRHTSLSYTNLP